MEFIEFLQNKYLPTLQIAPGLIQVGASLPWMVYRSTLFVGSPSFVFQVEIRIWSVVLRRGGRGERSGNQTGTLSPLRHPSPPPWGNTLRRFFPPPLAPGSNLPNNLRILPTDVTLRHHAPDVNLNATSGHYLLDFFPGLNPPDIPHGHSPRTFPTNIPPN